MPDEAGLALDYGTLTLRSVSAPLSGSLSATVNGEAVDTDIAAEGGMSTLRFEQPVVLEAGDELRVGSA